MEKEIRAAIVKRMRAGSITTSAIWDCCKPQVDRIVSGSPNMAAGLFVFWRIVGKIVEPDSAFNNPTRMPLALWTLKVKNDEM